MVQELIIMIAPVFLAGITYILYLKYVKYQLLTFPLDAHHLFRDKRIFGDHKTVSGPIIMSLGTAVYGTSVYSLMNTLQLPERSISELLILYGIIGLSYSLGELPNSFIKRQIGIPPGEKHSMNNIRFIFTVLDTFDSLISVGIAYFAIFHIHKSTVILAVILGGILHLLTDRFMVSLHLKKQGKQQT